MSTRNLLLTSAILILVSPIFRSTAAAQEKAEGTVPLRITHRVDPIYPATLSRSGTFEGSVSAMLEVNSQGELTDWLVLHATDEAFARALESVIGRWEFAPATQDGEPVPAAGLLDVRFLARGVFLTMNNAEAAMARVEEVSRERRQKERGRRVARISQLDRLPEPVRITEPALPADLPNDLRHGSVIMSFFIDQEGSVRIPTLDELDGHPVLARSAYAALRQWQFRPPTVEGKPVIVKAKQRFTFAPSEETENIDEDRS